MKTIDLIQGTPEWHAHRDAHDIYNASEAPAMMDEDCNGNTRAKLLRSAATGIKDEIDAHTQRRFDDGHKAEALARPIAESIVDEGLSPTTGIEVIDGLKLSASFDGISWLGNVCFEHKALNNTIRAALSDTTNAANLPACYRIQMEQQLAVSGAEKCLFLATKWNLETGELLEEMVAWYEPDLALRARIVAGWKQFAIDRDNYVHVETADAPKAEVSIELPALFIQAKGEITDSNMQEFGAALTKRLVEVRAIVLDTDQDFSNAKESAAMLRRRAKEMKTTKEAMLAQTLTIGEASRMMDAWSKDMNETALQLEKDVEKKDLEKKAAMVSGGRAKLVDYISAINTRLGGKFMPPMGCETFPGTIFSDAIKSKRKYSAMQDGIDAALANAKIEANEIADRIAVNQFEMFKNGDSSFLFPDFATVCTKAADDFDALLMARIAKHNEAQAAKDKAAKEAGDARIAAAVEAERKAGEARAAAAVEAERMAEAKRVAEQAAKDQRGKADAGVGVVDTARAQPDAAITPPIQQNEATIIKDFIQLLAISPADKKVLVDRLPAFVIYWGKRHAPELEAAA